MKSFIKLAIRFALFAVVVGIIVVSSLSAYEGRKKLYVYTNNAWDGIPVYQVLEKDSPYNIVLDQHSHSIHSDGVLTVRQNVLWHIAMGYNAMFVTDHNTMENKEDVAALQEEFKDKILIMQGMEWSTGRIHLNFLGIEDWDFEAFPIKKETTDADIKAAIDEAHRRGGLVTLNHFLWSTNKDRPTRQQFLDWGIDYIEVVNSDCYKTEFYDAESVAFCLENGIGQITGTDMHMPNYINANNSIHGWTLIAADTFTKESVMQQLREKNTKIIYSKEGTPLLGEFPTVKGYNTVRPFLKIGQYLKEIYIGQGNVSYAAIALVSLYCILLFIAGEGCRLLYLLLTKKLRSK